MIWFYILDYLKLEETGSKFFELSEAVTTGKVEVLNRKAHRFTTTSVAYSYSKGELFLFSASKDGTIKKCFKKLD